MSVDKKDFYGKEVTDAIKVACETLKVPQEQLEIEVIETGSTGIFGLIRKKAHIRAQIKGIVEDTVEEIFKVETLRPQPSASDVVDVEDVVDVTDVVNVLDVADATDVADVADVRDEPVEEIEEVKVEVEEPVEEEASEESLSFVKEELTRIVELMGYPSSVTVEAKGLKVQCVLSGEFEEKLTGPEGKTLDSLQYLLRKIGRASCRERVFVCV